MRTALPILLASLVVGCGSTDQTSGTDGTAAGEASGEPVGELLLAFTSRVEGEIEPCG